MRAFFIAITVLQFLEAINTASLSAKSKGSLPETLEPEDRAVTRAIEAEIRAKTKRVACSSDEIDSPAARNGIISTKARWEDFYIYIGEEYSDKHRTLINNAAYRLSQVIPCVDFRIWRKGEKPSEDYEGTYLHVMKTGEGCWSYTGKVFEGAQNISLDNGCMSVGTIMHEMIHALGFRHEQCRPDRDDYITIYLQNVIPGKEHNFKKYSYQEVTTYNVTYDTKSLMHYDSYAFSGNEKPTMLTKTGGKIADPEELAPGDITKLKRMYNC
ncbi:unnamed protein product [Orchesella dallaii]|uniref:Metalloendopeptidase n=1 Tax=Orchesella dallaii TaxID=48710 RepID=A0ABP1S8E2_9HEXA